jgi:predicted transcriptional regulator
MRVLLSIKPQYAKLIFEGVKKFEYRRTIFKNPKVKTVLVYASAPVKKVIGEFEIENVLNEDLNSLWKKTKAQAGIDENYFYQYFDNKSKGFAIKIKKVKKYRIPKCIKKDFNLNPPQSFVYL